MLFDSVAFADEISLNIPENVLLIGSAILDVGTIDTYNRFLTSELVIMRCGDVFPATAKMAANTITNFSIFLTILVATAKKGIAAQIAVVRQTTKHGVNV